MLIVWMNYYTPTEGKNYGDGLIISLICKLFLVDYVILESFPPELWVPGLSISCLSLLSTSLKISTLIFKLSET